MERITEEQLSLLVQFVLARISDLDALREGESRRAVATLRMVAYRQIAAIRHYRAVTPEKAARSEHHATASWNLLVSIAEMWRDHPEFPAGAAIETFEFDSENPLAPSG
ncbi:hypothetical protein AB0E59_18785 [Lentzea sp. NPDC034063]|uniref:hypothetical protein n=1 Tax=unclassified Lentzea TaxID=2643253 RepID=UPI0033E42631